MVTFSYALILKLGAKFFMSLLAQLGIAALLSGFIAGIARWRRSLTDSGTIGALISGTILFGLGGWAWGVILGVFFVSSSALSHFKEDEKKAAAEKFEKGHLLSSIDY